MKDLYFRASQVRIDDREPQFADELAIKVGVDKPGNVAIWVTNQDSPWTMAALLGTYLAVFPGSNIPFACLSEPCLFVYLHCTTEESVEILQKTLGVSLEEITMEEAITRIRAPRTVVTNPTMTGSTEPYDIGPYEENNDW